MYSQVLKESALVEAFNLKAAIEYNMKNHEAAREAMADAPPRTEEELDPVRACMQTRSKCCSCHIPFMHTARVVPVLRFLSGWHVWHVSGTVSAAKTAMSENHCCATYELAPWHHDLGYHGVAKTSRAIQQNAAGLIPDMMAVVLMSICVSDSECCLWHNARNVN